MKKTEILFIVFSSCLSVHPPELVRSGAIICKKDKLKNFYALKTAGGCGVVRFWSIKNFYVDEWKDLQLQLILK